MNEVKQGLGVHTVCTVQSPGQGTQYRTMGDAIRGADYNRGRELGLDEAWKLKAALLKST
jgi:hypothetical protein